MRTAIAGVAAGILLCVGALGSARAAEVVIPLEDFTRYDEFGGVKISPDGEFLAMSSGRFGRTLISFYNLAEKQVIGAVKASGSQEIDDFEWISATRLGYFPAQRWPGQSITTATGEICAIDRNGRRNALIYGPMSRSGRSSPISASARQAAPPRGSSAHCVATRVPS